MIRSHRSRGATFFILFITGYSLAVVGFPSQGGRVDMPLVWVLSTGGTIAGRRGVVGGAQRPATAMSSDGPRNLLNVIRTASAPDARGKGVLVVMNDEINGARDVTKTNTYRVETFRAPELGFLGYVDADRVT